MSNTGARAKLRAEQAKQRGRERRILLLVGVGILVVILAVGVGLWVWRTNLRPSAGPSPSSSSSATPMTLTKGQPITFGSASAPVKIALFEDFHCPHCAEFEEAYAGTLDKALSANQASVSIYPLAFIDQGSAAAANAFGCAAQAGYAQSYFTGLFANRNLEWNDGQLISLQDQVSGAPATDTFKTCVQQKQNAAWVTSIADVASQKDVKGTPTMFFDDKLVDLAAVGPDALATKIEQASKS